MRKCGKIILLAMMLCLVLGVSAFAGGEASGEPSAEPSAEPAVETVVGSEIRETLSADRFDVSFLVNGEECAAAAVEYTAEENVYTFRLSELLDALGVELSYNEETRVITVMPAEGGLLPFLSETAPMPAAEEADPLTELTPALARQMPVGAFFKKP